MIRNSVTVAPDNLDADSVCATQTPLDAGALTLNGVKVSSGVATLAAAQKITVTSVGDDSGRTFTLTGTDADGQAQTEDLTGASGAAATSTKYYKTMTAVSVDAATADAVTVGHTAVSVSPTFTKIREQAGFVMGFGSVVTGTVNYTVQHTYDGTNWFDHATAAGKTAAFNASYTVPPYAVRVLMNSATSGSVVTTFVQCSV